MRLLASLIALLVVVVAAPAAHAAVGDSCADRFPEVAWVTVSDGAVTIEATGLTDGLIGRYDTEISLVEGWIVDEIGPLEATVCLVDPDAPFDTSRYVSGSQRFHARMEMEEQLLIINVERFGFVGPASAWALAHHALWQNGVDGGNPEPISSVIGQWYRARILDRLELYHREVMVDNFFDTEAVIDWTADRQPPVLDWDPERNFQAVGDFVDFAVATYGTQILLESSGERWSEIEGEWRSALRADLTGRTTPTTDWIIGISLAVAAVVIAAVAAVLGFWSKRRRKRRSPTAAPIPGFFSEG
jgi:hypothetical protein